LGYVQSPCSASFSTMILDILPISKYKHPLSKPSSITFNRISLNLPQPPALQVSKGNHSINSHYWLEHFSFYKGLWITSLQIKSTKLISLEYKDTQSTQIVYWSKYWFRELRVAKKSLITCPIKTSSRKNVVA
jgi:hypothetical protein